MALYNNVYYQIPSLLKFYRVDKGQFAYFDPKTEESLITPDSRYIYFSKNMNHHEYFASKRIRQYIEGELKKVGLSLHWKYVYNNDKFKTMVTCIEKAPFDEPLVSVECSTSQIFGKLLKNNFISNREKKANDRRIEYVDPNKCSGGYGFCDEWLQVFDILTYFYAYQKITKEDVMEFLYAYKQKLVTKTLKINPISFLSNPQNRTISINKGLFCDFEKYDLMNALQSIVENELYFKESIFGDNPNDLIRGIIQQYCHEREDILALTDGEYQRGLVRSRKLNKPTSSNSK